jgi:hypothetical protein
MTHKVIITDKQEDKSPRFTKQAELADIITEKICCAELESKA